MREKLLVSQDDMVGSGSYYNVDKQLVLLLVSPIPGISRIHRQVAEESHAVLK